MSDNFEKHAECRNLFLHTVESLHKPFIIITVGASMDWRNTHIGFVIGPQEVSLDFIPVSTRVSIKKSVLKVYFPWSVTVFARFSGG